MSTQTLEQTNTANTGNDNNEIEHIYCDCTPHKGLCGTDIKVEEPDMGIWEDYTEDMCVVCVDLDSNNIPCFNCGFKYED